MTTKSVWMTEAARRQLEEELAELERNPADADAARVAELRGLLRNAEVERKPDDGLVEPGMQVTVRFDHDGTESVFLLGSREVTGLDPSVDIDVYSPTSPLGAAINGHRIGEAVTFQAPSGQQRITILAATPFG